MIKWDREEVARFLEVMWKYPESPRGDLVATFPVKSGRAELRVSPQRDEIELTLFAGRATEEQLASWLMVCERIDVHADVNETPCITLWPPSGGMTVFSWLGIYREGRSFSLYSGTAPAFVMSPAPRSVVPELAAF